MANGEGVTNLYKAHQAGQEKYTYFLLAAAGAAIGLAVQKTEGLKLSWWLLPVAAATLCWALSFVCGCKNVHWVHAVISANVALLKLQNGTHPEQPPYPEHTAVAIEGVRLAIDNNAGWAGFNAMWQFRLLVAGAVFFIVWRIAEMIRIS